MNWFKETIYIVNKDNKLTKPYNYNYVKTFNKDTFSIEYKQDRTKKYPIKLFSRGYEYKFLGVIKTNIHLLGVDEGCNFHILGTDINGCDVFSRLFFGQDRRNSANLQ